MYLQNSYQDYNEHIIINLQKSKTETSWMYDITYKSRKQK